MSMLFDSGDVFIIQGMTGNMGRHCLREMSACGTMVGAGVVPGKGGEWLDGKAIFDTVQRAVDATGATAALVCVPSYAAADAMIESINAGIKKLVCVTERLPLHDAMRVIHYARWNGVTLLGPSSAGIQIPGHISVGLIPRYVSTKGNIGIVSKSGTLLYDVAYTLTKLGLGQSALVNIGNDVMLGLGFVDILEMFENDPMTERVVLLGEIGGHEETRAAQYIHSEMTKPVVAFVTGLQLPQFKRIGHGGALIKTFDETAEAKTQALLNAGVRVARYVEQIPELLTHLD